MSPNLCHIKNKKMPLNLKVFNDIKKYLILIKFISCFYQWNIQMEEEILP